MDENIERLSELVRKPQLTMIGAPPTIDAAAFAIQLFGSGSEYYYGFHLESNESLQEHRFTGNKNYIFELQSIFAFKICGYENEVPICSEAREYDYGMFLLKRDIVRAKKTSVIALADFTKNAFNAPAELSSFTGNARLVYMADAVLAMQKFQNAIRVSCLKAPWKNYTEWREPLVDFFVEYEPESRAFHEVPAPEVSPLEDLNHINTRKRSARK